MKIPIIKVTNQKSTNREKTNNEHFHVCEKFAVAHIWDAGTESVKVSKLVHFKWRPLKI
jgi:hypothetical protein